jgi:hypothetical protein
MGYIRRPRMAREAGVKYLLEVAGVFLFAIGGSALDTEGVIAVLGFAAMAIFGFVLLREGMFLDGDRLEDDDGEE